MATKAKPKAKRKPPKPTRRKTETRHRPGSRTGRKGLSVFTIPTQKRFLAQLAMIGNVTQACEAAQICKPTAYNLRNKDPEFAAEWEHAEQKAILRLEAEAWRRGVEGVDKPIIYQGEIMGTFKEYSDRMLELLLKGNAPDKYRERVSTELSGPGGKPLEVSSVERTARIGSMLEAARRRREIDEADDPDG